MSTSSRLVSATISALFALVVPDTPLAAQVGSGDESKLLAEPAADPEPTSLEWLLGGARVDAASLQRRPPPCAVQRCDAAASCFPGSNSACLLATFPEVQWRICVQASAYGDLNNQHSRGIAIGPVDVRRRLTPELPWQRLIHRAEVAENLTPYHHGQSHLSDDQFANWTNWRRKVTPADAFGGALITLSQDTSFGPSIVAECRDRGPAWLCKGQQGSFVRRGKELVVWGVYDAGNYDYIQEFTFRDDGTIALRSGATGYLNPERPEDAHTHDSLWRIDLDVNGAGGDSAFVSRHVEPLLNDPSGLDSSDELEPFNGGVEGAEDWKPEEFNTLVIQDSAKNASGRAMSYELEPERTGTIRHFGGSEQWSRHDFWVTRFKTAEDTSWATMNPFTGPDGFLLPYVSDHESVEQGDLVVWYLAGAHHEPISEDLDLNQKPAVTNVHWYGFELKPHDFFDFNPLGGPSICD